MIVSAGCRATRPAETRPTTASALSAGQYIKAIDAMCYPPPLWRPEPLKSSSRHWHQLWISPTGNTAYGIIRMSLPVPVGPSIVLHRGFLPNMKASEGRAELMGEPVEDDQLPGLRFVADGNLYLVRANLITYWFDGWAIYAGTLRAAPIDEAELAQAVQSRERTRIGPYIEGAPTSQPAY